MVLACPMDLLAILVSETHCWSMTRKPSLGFHECPTINQPPPNSRRQNGHTKQALFYRPTVMQWPVNLTVIWRLLLSVYGMVTFYKTGNIALIMLKTVGASVLNSVGWVLCTPDLNGNGKCACAEGLLVLTVSLCLVTLRTCTTNSSVFLDDKRVYRSQRFENRSGSVSKAKSLCGLECGWGLLDWKSEE
jgi:hypothetical protein